MLIRPEYENQVLDVQPGEPRWLLWVRRVIFYTIFWGGFALFIVAGRVVWSLLFWD